MTRTVIIDGACVRAPEGAIAYRYAGYGGEPRWVYDEHDRESIADLDPSLLADVAPERLRFEADTWRTGDGVVVFIHLPDLGRAVELAIGADALYSLRSLPYYNVRGRPAVCASGDLSLEVR